MSGGIFPGYPFTLNIKCIIFSLIIMAIYTYCPPKVNSIIKILLIYFIIFVISLCFIHQVAHIILFFFLLKLFIECLRPSEIEQSKHNCFIAKEPCSYLCEILWHILNWEFYFLFPGYMKKLFVSVSIRVQCLSIGVNNLVIKRSLSCFWGSKYDGPKHKIIFISHLLYFIMIYCL